MKARLSKAHRTYLDMGRKDLIKHGGAFHKPRPKNVSNAFLAEEELEEMSAAGSIQGAPSVKRKRKMTKQEKRLRMKIREGLKRYFNAKSQEHEKQISKIIRTSRLKSLLLLTVRRTSQLKTLFQKSENCDFTIVDACLS